jgi:hypothetical protein
MKITSDTNGSQPLRKSFTPNPLFEPGILCTDIRQSEIVASGYNHIADDYLAWTSPLAGARALAERAVAYPAASWNDERSVVADLVRERVGGPMARHPGPPRARPTPCHDPEVARFGRHGPLVRPRRHSERGLRTERR